MTDSTRPRPAARPPTAAHPLGRTLTVYEPPTRSVPALGPYWSSVWERRALIWHLARTAMKARHYDTALGKAWVVLDPIVMAFTFFLVRVVFAPGRADGGFYIAHIILGVSLFFYVRDVLEGTGRCVVAYRQLVLNTSNPLGVFPAVVLVRAIIDLVPTLFVYLGVHLITGQPLGIQVVALPVALVLLTGFALGAGLALAPLVTFNRDVGTVIPYTVRIWMYLTPVMYSINEIPSTLQPFLRWNPLYPAFTMFESIFAATWPPLWAVVASTVWAAVAMAGGTVIFLRRERDYAIRL